MAPVYEKVRPALAGINGRQIGNYGRTTYTVAPSVL
jgi:hypothetical protein